jgi:hypothetical protein
MKSFRRSVRLQRQKRETPAGQEGAKSPGERLAIPAVGVVKDPAGNFLIFCNFSIHRNSFSKFFIS